MSGTGPRRRTSRTQQGDVGRGVPAGSGAGLADQAWRGLFDDDRSDGPVTERDPTPVLFTHAGPVAVDDGLSPPYEHPAASTLLSARCRLAVAGSSDTAVLVYRDGSSIGTILWGSGETLAVVAFDEPFLGDDSLLQVQCTEAGTGAEGITIRFEFQ